MSKNYTLCINAYTPETFPMARLAKYVQVFANFLGHKESVHLEGLKSGSVQVVARVEDKSAGKVAQRLERVKNGKGSANARKQLARIDGMLAEDNASGSIKEGDNQGAVILSFPFPVVDKPRAKTYGPITQEDSLSGKLIHVGGEPAHIQLQDDGRKHTGLETDQKTARQLAKHLYEPVRVFGTATWFRDENEKWILKGFRVASFKILEDDDLVTAVQKLRSIGSTDWSKMEDPHGFLNALRE